MVPIYSLLLFGGSLTVDASAGLLSVDGWAEFKAPASVGVLVKGLRDEVDAVLAAKIRDPGLELSESRAAGACMELLSSDGF
jgi:ATP-dependent RNA helicase DHX57